MEGNYPILILDWKGPGDKIKLVPRVVIANNGLVDGVNVSARDGIETRCVATANIRISWRLVVSRKNCSYNHKSIVKPYVDKLIRIAGDVERVMLVRMSDCVNGISPEKDLMLDEMPEDSYNKYIAPLVCNNFDVRIASMLSRNELPYCDEMNTGEVDLSILRQIYHNDVVFDDKTNRLLDDLRLSFPDNGIEPAQHDLIRFYKTVIKSQPAVYQKYVDVVTLLAAPVTCDIDCD